MQNCCGGGRSLWRCYSGREPMVAIGIVGTCRTAAGGGHLEVLQWARTNGCDWDSSTCSNAAAGGYLEVLQWAAENGCEYDEETLERAVEHGGELLHWAVQHGYSSEADESDSDIEADESDSDYGE